MVAAVSPDDDAFPFQFDDEGGGVVLEGACVFGAFGEFDFCGSNMKKTRPRNSKNTPVVSYQSQNRKSVDCDYSSHSSVSSQAQQPPQCAAHTSTTAKQPSRRSSSDMCTQVTCDSTNALLAL